MYDSNAVLMEDDELMSEVNIVSRFNEIYDSTHKSILTFITARCGNTADINDIFQDTYMELYQILSKHGANHVIDGKAYIFRIAKRKLAQNYSLLKKLRNIIPMGIITDNNEEIELSDAEANSFIMENSVINEIMLENARKYINQKPADIKKVFYLFYDVGITIPEIARELSMSESNVKHKLYRTIKELQNLLKGGEQ